MTREQIYTEKMKPLVKQLFDLADEYKVPFTAWFAVENGVYGTNWNDESNLNREVDFICNAARIIVGDSE